MEQALTAETIERPPDIAVQGFSGESATHGPPIAKYLYEDLHGPLFYVCDYGDGEADVSQVCWTWRRGDWRAFWPPKPRPLFQLSKLQKSPKAPVLIVDDEGSAVAAQRLMRDTIVTTWPGSGNAIAHVDWPALAGRQVNIWPTNREESYFTAAKIAGYLVQLECKVGVIDSRTAAAGFNLAVAVTQGWQLRDVLKWGKEHKKEVRPVPIVPEPPEAEDLGDPGYDLGDDNKSVSMSAQWQALALSSVRGVPHCNLDNAAKVLAGNLDRWNVYYDEFMQRVMVFENGVAREWVDVDDLNLSMWYQRAIGMHKMASSTVAQAVALVSFANKRNLVADWLHTLGDKWDRVNRLEQLMTRGFGAPENLYTQCIGKNFLMGMVARVLFPGCKLDNMPVFEGVQGGGKSSALRLLGGEYFTEQHEKAGDKDFYLVLRGKMLVEISELSAFSRAEIERVKGVVSNQVDTYRAPYDRRAQDHPRMCCFAGTTNVNDWNTDDTGARRFWPIATGVIDLKWIELMREQLLAEAVWRVEFGEDWHVVPHELARREQESRHAGDVFDEALKIYLSNNPVVTMAECLREGLGIVKPEQWDRNIQSRVNGVLRRSGYSRSTSRDERGVTIRCWKRLR